MEERRQVISHLGAGIDACLLRGDNDAACSLWAHWLDSAGLSLIPKPVPGSLRLGCRAVSRIW